MAWVLLAAAALSERSAPRLGAPAGASARPCSRHDAAVRLTVPCSRRDAVRLAAIGSLSLVPASAVHARTPGSYDVGEAVTQIKDASKVLRSLRDDWKSYAVIDAEGRAGNIDAARRILGGVAPQRGDAAIEVAKATPLYRIDGAFAAVRKGALNSDDAWASRLDIEEFVEVGDDIIFSLKKVDDAFYGVVFASKGSKMLSNIYDDARRSVDQAILDFDKVLKLLKEAGVPES